VELVAETKGARRGSIFEHLRLREGRCIVKERAEKRANFQACVKWKNAPREHPDDEFFGFAE